MISTINSTEYIQALSRGARLGVVTDMDGTVSPITANPDQSQLTPRALKLLAELRDKVTLVAVVSGRAVENLRAHVGLTGVVYVGNHGLETMDNGKVQIVVEAANCRPQLQAALDELRRHLLPNMWIEDKNATASIHYRTTNDPDAVRESWTPIFVETAQKHGLGYFHGRRVFELRPPVPINKGTALTRLVQQYALDSVVFFGDDTTDVDAMLAARKLREENICYGVSVGVESDATPESVRVLSDVLVSGIEGVESFLEALSKNVNAAFN